MPIYEYECTDCGERFELHRKITDSDGETICPRCGKKQPRKVFSTFARTSSNGTCSSHFG